MLPAELHNDTTFSLTIFDATSQLAMMKILPALWKLFRDNRLPEGTNIFLFTRKPLDLAKFQIECMPNMRLDHQLDTARYNSFWQIVHSYDGKFENEMAFKLFKQSMVAEETKHNMTQATRIFYVAAPATKLNAITANVALRCLSKNGDNRIILEKPFGRNDFSYKFYQGSLCKLFEESQIYMIDRLLSKTIVFDVFALRFANRVWSETWSGRHIESVMINYSTEVPVLDTTGSFDSLGIIRDVMTNHMMQILALIAMEQPYTLSANDVRTEKLNLLRDVEIIDFRHVVLGQYINNRCENSPYKIGYRQHAHIPQDTITPTFCLLVLHIQNRRWSGVPFILRAGRALSKTKTEVRIVYKPVVCRPFEHDRTIRQNELVIQLVPNEQIFMRVMLRRPGDAPRLTETRLHLTLNNVASPSASKTDNLPSLLLDVFNGDQMLFLHTEEQFEIWRIFSPILREIEVEAVKPWAYLYGSKGPTRALQKATEHGFRFYKPELWDEEIRPLLAASIFQFYAGSKFK